MSLEEAVQAQQDEPRKIMMDVYTQWCGPCKMMMRNTFTNADVIAYINANYYAVKFDAESQGPVTYQDKTFENRMESQCAWPQQHASAFASSGRQRVSTLVYFDENANVIAPIQATKPSAT